MSFNTVVPADWKVAPLGIVSTKIQDGTHFSPPLGGGECQYITSRNIGAGRLRLDSVEMISEEEHRKIYTRCDTRFGDLLLTKDGANTGNAALNTFRDEVSLLSSVAFIRSDGRYSTESYVLQYLLSDSGRKQITEAMTGNAITRLTLAKIKALQLPLPPIGEQHAIARVLGDADLHMDALERLIEKKRAIKRGVMQEVLTGKTRLPGFTRSWTPKMFGDLAFLVRDRELPGNRAGRLVELEHIDSGTGRLRGDADLSGSVSMKTRFAKGDVLFGKLRAYLRKYWLADREGYCSTEIWALRARPGIAVGEFVRYLVEADQFIVLASTSHGTHMPRSDWGVVSKWEIGVPGIDEQAAIARVLLDSDAEIEALERRLVSARALKQAIVQELLTGRTRLRAQEDEA